MVISFPTMCQLDKDTHDLSVVVITGEKIVHQYYSLDELSERGIYHDMKVPIKEWFLMLSLSFHVYDIPFC